METKNKLKFYYFIYFILIILVFLLIFKFFIDFYQSNKKNIHEINSISQENKNVKVISYPRMQIDKDSFNYITAKKGYLNYNDDLYIFEGVEMISDYGYIKSGKLEVSDDKNVFNFTIDPIFKIYLDNIEEDKI